MTRPDDSLAALLLTSHLVERDQPPLKAAEFWALVKGVGSFGSLLGRPPSEIQERAGITQDQAERVASLLADGTSFAFELEAAESRGLQVISALDPEYPTSLREHLGNAAPPRFTSRGPPTYSPTTA